jgi:uncharacterized protein (DUF1800 family)
MRRRSFLAEAIDDLAPEQKQQRRPAETVSKFANRTIPRLERASAGLEPYAGPWGYDQAAHLLRRTMFGATQADILATASQALDDVITQLLTDLPAPDPPLNTNSSDLDVPVGETWINAATNNYNTSRNNSLKSWWIGLMLAQPVSLREKMTLFWHNHLVTETADVKDARQSYRYLALLRQYALGNFKDLVKQVTLDCAMLRYLNGNANTKASPNENYARELQELFTIGKGPEQAPGDYTNYTEQDVIAAARVLTGWRDSNTTFQAYFTLSRHDTANKVFSSAYGGTVITGSSDGNQEIDALLAMIFAQPETAKCLCRKLYRWFVYYVIDDAVEANIIVPLADILRSNNYEIKPALSALFRSAHFFDSINTGCVIKNPVDFTVGLCRQFAVPFPAAASLTAQYNHWKYVRTQAGNMQQELGDPPNVAGWPAYYQVPQFHELWINSATLPLHAQFTDTLLGPGYRQNGFTLVADPIAFAGQFSDPSDPNLLIDESARLLFPIPLTVNQHTALKEALIPGLPDYEWTAEWNSYLADPTNAEKETAVKTKLQGLFAFMASMAEYHLM